jgi:hypothetical protein
MRFGDVNPSSTAAFRATTAASPPITLHRKRCACGAVVTAKRLTQYGACAPCVAALEQQRAQQAFSSSP